jgi:hypothetical protein
MPVGSAGLPPTDDHGPDEQLTLIDQPGLESLRRERREHRARLVGAGHLAPTRRFVSTYGWWWGPARSRLDNSCRDGKLLSIWWWIADGSWLRCFRPLPTRPGSA